MTLKCDFLKGIYIMYIVPNRLLLQDDHELQYISASDKTLRIVIDVVLAGVALFPWFALSIS
jgi:hypothetical protein